MTTIPQLCHSAPIHLHNPKLLQDNLCPPSRLHLHLLMATPFVYSTWRAPRPINGWPVRYYCGICGHISCLCRRRQLDVRHGYVPYEWDNCYGYFLHQPVHSPSPRRLSPPPDTTDVPRNCHSSGRRCLSPFPAAL